MTIPIFGKLKLFCMVVTLALGACGGGASNSPAPSPVPEVVAPPVPDKRSVLTLQLMDTRSQAAGTGPLNGHPYDSFSFLLNGNPIVVTSRAINSAKTFADLRSAIEGAVNALKPTNPSLANLAVTLGPNYTIFDTVSGVPVVGQSILITDVSGGTITLNRDPARGGWFPSVGFVPVQGIHNRVFDSNSAIQ